MDEPGRRKQDPRLRGVLSQVRALRDDEERRLRPAEHPEASIEVVWLCVVVEEHGGVTGVRSRSETSGA